MAFCPTPLNATSVSFRANVPSLLCKGTSVSVAVRQGRFAFWAMDSFDDPKGHYFQAAW